MMMLRKAMESQNSMCKSLAKWCFYSGCCIWACQFQNKKNEKNKGNKKNNKNKENRY